MKFKEKLKKGCLSLVFLASSASGCALHFQRSNETVDVSAIVLPFVSSSMEIKHEIYEDEKHSKLRSAFDTRMDQNILNQEFNMRVYGSDRKFLWSYKFNIKNEGNSKYVETKIYDSKGKLAETVRDIPEGLPARVMFNNHRWIDYFSVEGRSIDPESLVERK